MLRKKKTNKFGVPKIKFLQKVMEITYQNMVFRLKMTSKIKLKKNILKIDGTLDFIKIFIENL